MQKALTHVNSLENDCFADDAVDQSINQSINQSICNAHIIYALLKWLFHITATFKSHIRVRPNARGRAKTFSEQVIPIIYDGCSGMNVVAFCTAHQLVGFLVLYPCNVAECHFCKTANKYLKKLHCKWKNKPKCILS